MSTIDPLILDLLEWIGPQGRPYADVMDAWRTSCPRLPVWEEANERGFLDQRREPGRGTIVSVSTRGANHLKACRPQANVGTPARVVESQMSNPSNVE